MASNDVTLKIKLDIAKEDRAALDTIRLLLAARSIFPPTGRPSPAAMLHLFYSGQDISQWTKKPEREYSDEDYS